jgi:hypothetical protein
MLRAGFLMVIPYRAVPEPFLRQFGASISSLFPAKSVASQPEHKCAMTQQTLLSTTLEV